MTTSRRGSYTSRSLQDEQIRSRNLPRRALLRLLGPLGAATLGGCIARSGHYGSGTTNTVYTGCTDNDTSYMEPLTGQFVNADAGGYGRYACAVPPLANPNYQGYTDHDFGLYADPVGLGRSCGGAVHGQVVPHAD